MKTNILKIAVFAMMLATGFYSCTQQEYELTEITKEQSVLKHGAEKEFFYTDKGEKEYFNIRADKVIIKTKSEADAKALCKHEVFLSAYNIAFVWVIATIDPQKTTLENLMLIPEVVDATYGLEYADGTLQYPKNQIFVKHKEGQSLENVLNESGLSDNVEKIELFNPRSELFLVTLNTNLCDILRICRDLYESELCKSADPSFILEMKPHNTHYDTQWGLRNVGQNGGTPDVDIQAEPAWNFTTGNTGIRVAVLDDGVQLDHPDLQANLVPGADFTVNSPGGANGSPWLGGNNLHGTACAGVIAAVDNAIGIKGVAPNVRIVPIRIAWRVPGANNWTADDTWIANGITHAWQTANADVLNNSWGSGAWSSTITDAINDAVLYGRVRNGIPLGCVVVASSGNDNMGIVSFPARQANVIAVGAINRNGLRWNAGVYIGSNHGDALNVVAPGVDIWTTTLTQLGSYNPETSTSMAAPHVAGIAALILSYNPNLRHNHVSAYIYQSCTKLPGYTYINNPAHPYGTWDSQVGHGLVNALGALVKAGASVTISGPNVVGCTPATFTIPSLSGTVSWVVPSSLQIMSQNQTTLTVLAGSGSTATITVRLNGIDIAQKTVTLASSTVRDVTFIEALQPSTYTGGTINFRTHPYPPLPNENFEWRVTPSSNTDMSVNGNYCDVTFYSSGDYYIEARVYDACYTGTWVGRTVTVY